MPKTTPKLQPTSPSTTATPRRVLLKLSGEAFCTVGGFGIDREELRVIAEEIKSARENGAEIAVVVGGGNIIRGAELAKQGDIPQSTADYMGMLGTVINGVALKEMLETVGVPTRLMSAIEIRAVAEPFIRGRALRHLEKGRVVIMAAGTGNPFFTTDSCAALRASELECDLLLKATKVDGVYTADPKKDPTATKYDTLSYAQAIDQRLGVMDLTALAMCEERNIPVLVFDFWQRGNIRRVIDGDESIGTRLS
ncbi:MAG: uridylate kinase [Phycisphaeraceae bacterium]|nr:MAG: uridylate kinase [Phycisphaeraceae bacterium]